MSLTVLDHIAFRLDVETLLASLGMNGDMGYGDELQMLVNQANAIASPKGIYRVARVESKDQQSVVIDGKRFTSRILRVNLDAVEQVFPFVATCGVELEEWSREIDGMLLRYCADAVKEIALDAAVEALGKHLVETYRPGSTSMMNPGSLPDWPTQEQGNLFALFGEGTQAISVRLTESFVMYPAKSVSGIWFPSKSGFQSCQLCPRQRCSRRKAPYDAGLYDRKYVLGKEDSAK